MLVAQTGRYHQAVFDSITVTKDIQYGMADFYDANSNHDLAPLYLNFFEPFGDTFPQRPLVITIFGGAFLGGNKDWEDMTAWCDSLARHGYACASIQYRLLFNPLSTPSMVRASYRAVQDTRAAVRFLKENAFAYRIDTSKIFLLGNSAGSITALHTAFITSEGERPLSTYGVGTASDSDDLGCLDCSGNSFAHTVKLAGIISLWGGVWDINWIEPEESLPALLIHGTADGTVPYDTGYAFDLTFTPFVYGSLPIDRRMDELGIPHEFYPFDSLGHSFYMSNDSGSFFRFPNEYWEPVFALGNEFLYKVVSNTFTGIAYQTNDIHITIFPNPAEGRIFLNLPQSAVFPLQLCLLNPEGKKIKSWVLPSYTRQSLDVSGIPGGMYFLHVHDGQQHHAGKLLVK